MVAGPGLPLGEPPLLPPGRPPPFLTMGPDSLGPPLLLEVLMGDKGLGKLLNADGVELGRGGALVRGRGGWGVGEVLGVGVGALVSELSGVGATARGVGVGRFDLVVRRGWRWGCCCC